jgi:hypothetical protein
MRALRTADRELLKALFGDVGHPLASRCAGEILNSPRFATFLNSYRGKIGKKARSLEGAGRWPDLWLELWTAAQLLSDRRFEVRYESYAAQKTRGPDFTATFRTRIVCNIEIKHVRAELSFAKWGEVLCTKLGQLPPGCLNVLLVGTGNQIAETCSVDSAAAELSAYAGRGEDTIFERYGLLGARDYQRHIGRLSGMLRVADWNLATAVQKSLWRNPSARHVLPDDLAQALLA